MHASTRSEFGVTGLPPLTRWACELGQIEAWNIDEGLLITALRMFVNLTLNLTLDSRVIKTLDPGRFPYATIAVNAAFVTALELSPIVLEGGIRALASEGKGDREMFDKLHLLLTLQDVLHLRMHGEPPADVEREVMRRQLDPATLQLIEDKDLFDDVREHLAALRRSKEPRRAGADRATDFVLFEPNYPTKAMKKKFGSITSGTPPARKTCTVG